MADCDLRVGEVALVWTWIAGCEVVMVLGNARRGRGREAS